MRFWLPWHLSGILVAFLGFMVVMFAGHDDSVAFLGWVLIPGAWLAASITSFLLPGEALRSAFVIVAASVLGQVALWHLAGLGVRRLLDWRQGVSR